MRKAKVITRTNRPHPGGKGSRSTRDTGKLRVGLLFGGRSGEHEVSLLSAASVRQAMDKNKYEIVPIGITKDGLWLSSSRAETLLAGQAGLPASALQSPEAETLFLNPSAANQGKFLGVDVVFPVMHGTFGEDGTIQGLLEMADVAYVGAGVLGSAAGMDKDVMKRLFAAAGLPIVRHLTFLRHRWETEPKQVRREVEDRLRYPVFVKPANLGSSVGISKARNAAELTRAIDLAASFDRKIVIEESVGGRTSKAREIECSVLGNDDPQASIAGEVIPQADFYDYAAKYIDQSSRLVIPADLRRAEMKQVQQLAIRAFQSVDCAGLARVDFLMHPKTRKIYVNEINTMPGFTSISMYPKLWQASGLKYSDLIDRLIELGLESHAEKKKNRYSM